MSDTFFKQFLRPLMFGFGEKNVRVAKQHGGPVYAPKYRTSMDPSEHPERKSYVYGAPSAQRTMSWRKAAGSKRNKKHRFVGTHAGDLRGAANLYEGKPDHKARTSRIPGVIPAPGVCDGDGHHLHVSMDRRRRLVRYRQR